MSILYKKDDELKAEKIFIKARNIKTDKRPSAGAGTSTHKIQTGKMEGTAYCVILKPLRTLKKSL